MDKRPLVKFRKLTLRDIRKRLNLTQEELAIYLDMDRGSISKLESGKDIPSWLIKAIKLHEFLKRAGCTFDDLTILPYDETDN